MLFRLASLKIFLKFSCTVIILSKEIISRRFLVSTIIKETNLRQKQVLKKEFLINF